MELEIHGYELTLRLEDAEKIEVEKVSEEEAFNIENSTHEKPDTQNTEHPGFGEDGKYHSKGDGNPLPDDTVLTYALVGNQNCGKTTLFNQLTGSNQHVGNFPGVTVDRKDGVIRGYPKTLVTDLPGIYSMSLLGVPVIPISAAKNQGVEELVKHAVHVAHFQEKPERQACGFLLYRKYVLSA